MVVDYSQQQIIKHFKWLPTIQINDLHMVSSTCKRPIKNRLSLKDVNEKNSEFIRTKPANMFLQPNP